jgi:hypothetical protein
VTRYDPKVTNVRQMEKVLRNAGTFIKVLEDK